MTQEPFKELHGLYVRFLAPDISSEDEEALDKKISALEKKLKPEQVAFFHFVQAQQYGGDDPRAWIHQDFLDTFVEEMKKGDKEAYRSYSDLCAAHISASSHEK